MRIALFFVFLLQDQLYSGIILGFYVSCFHYHVTLPVVKLAGAINHILLRYSNCGWNLNRKLLELNFVNPTFVTLEKKKCGGVRLR
jgi:hypothetical protein